MFFKNRAQCCFDAAWSYNIFLEILKVDFKTLAVRRPLASNTRGTIHCDGTFELLTA